MNSDIDKITVKSLISNNPDNIRICPICKYSGKFEPFGTGRPRLNAQCPECNSIERARLYYLYLLSIDLLRMDSCTVLHAMPEQCIRYKINNVPNIKYTPYNLNELTKTEYKDGEVDVIIANYILDRVDDDVSVIKEFERILSDNGIAMLSVHMEDFIDSVLDTLPRKYGRDYTERLEKCGLRTERITAEELCGNTISYIYGIRPEDAIILAKRK